MAELTIGEVAKHAGVQPSALRYYERLGLLPPAQRVNGKRRYDPSILQAVARLQFAQRAGFTLAEIKQLWHGFDDATPPAERWQALAEAKFRELEQTIAQANAMKQHLEAGLQCQCLRLEDCQIINASQQCSG